MMQLTVGFAYEGKAQLNIGALGEIRTAGVTFCYYCIF
jgi:hypothetical protein